MLHLAFKQQTTEEIYDALAFCFMRAARRYDPFYTDKVKRVCKEIDGEKKFTAAVLAGRVGLDPSGILRTLARKGFLSSVVGKKRKVISYQQANWPPSAEYLASSPIGFVYVLQMWFRYYLNEHIIAQMGEIESLESMFQLFESGKYRSAYGRSRLVGCRCLLSPAHEAGSFLAFAGRPVSVARRRRDLPSSSCVGANSPLAEFISKDASPPPCKVTGWLVLAP